MFYIKKTKILAACLLLALLCAGNNASGYTGGDHDPYVQNVTQNIAVIMWQTDANSDSMVEYGLTTSYGNSVYSAALVNNHEMALPDLAPYTVYHYRTSHDAGSGPVYSADSTFKTAPLTTVTFSFTVITDSHKTGTDIVLPQVINGILSLGTPSLVLHAGDLTDDGIDEDWNWYFFGTTSPNPMMGPLISKTAMYPSRGNHEKDATYYFYFDMPNGGGYNNEEWYSYNYSNAHFIHLNSNNALTSGSPQAIWLENDLASATAEWVFVTLHHPPISTNYLHGLFRQYGVDVVFCGHDHFYDRAYREGVYYITAATAGGDPWNAHGTRWSQYTESTSGFVTVDIAGTTATVKGRYPNTTVFDSVVIAHAVDTIPPSPNPMTWSVLPYAIGSSSIAMTATTATDASGVEYLFDCTTAGGHDSVWQSGTTYTDTGLQPNTQYCYRVQARDKSPNQNATGWSTTQCATTQSGGTMDMYVYDITMSSYSPKSNFYAARATVWIKDETAANVSGATVTGSWSGATSGSSSGSTGADGKVTLTSKSVKGGGTFTFTVTNVAATGYTYNPSMNIETSDSITAP